MRCSTPLLTVPKRRSSSWGRTSISIVADYSSDDTSSDELTENLKDICKSQESLTSCTIPPQHWRNFLPNGSALAERQQQSSNATRDYFASDPPWEDHTSSDEQPDSPYKACSDTGQVKRGVRDESPTLKRSRSTPSASSPRVRSPSLSPVLRGGLLWKGPSTYTTAYLQESDGASGLLENYVDPELEEGEVLSDSPPYEIKVGVSTAGEERSRSSPNKVWPYLLESDVGLIDTHCHLDFLFKRMYFKGTFARFRSMYDTTFPECYEGCVAIFCNPMTFGNPAVWEDLLKEDGVWGAFGCHPHMALDYTEETDEHLINALQNPKVVALGEIGLDYSHKNSCSHSVQKAVFKRQLLLALQFQLPLVIHSRDATQDTLKILKETIPKNYPVHRHCFTGSWSEAEQWLETFPSLCLGLTPLVSFAYTGGLREVAYRIPLERVLLETDAPYFLPKSEVGSLQHSHPGMAIHVATALSAIKGVSVETVLKAVRENTQRIYKI